MSETTMPWTWTQDRWTRLSRNADEHLWAVCAICGLPALTVKPCRGGRGYTMRCSACRIRGFAKHASLTYGMLGLGAILGEDPPTIGTRLQVRRKEGASRLRERWQPRLGRDGKPIRSGLAGAVGCVGCGDAGSAEIATWQSKRSVQVRTFVSCAGCGLRVFEQTGDPAVAAVVAGWTVLVGSLDATAWKGLEDRGRAVFGKWSVPLPAAAVAARRMDATTEVNDAQRG